MKRRKTTPRARAKKRAWDAFSLYIRTRDGHCVTCPTGSAQHAGHFIDGRHNAVLFSEEGVHGQCYHCNVGLKGNKLEYWLFMEKKYGRKAIDRLMAESKQTVIYKEWQFEEIAQLYKNKLKELLQS